MLLYASCPQIAYLLQLHKNYTRKCTKGWSSDFAFISWCGFFLLMVNQVLGWCSPYAGAGRVNTVEVLAAISFQSITCVTMVQTFVYPSDPASK